MSKESVAETEEEKIDVKTEIKISFYNGKQTQVLSVCRRAFYLHTTTTANHLTQEALIRLTLRVASMLLESVHPTSISSLSAYSSMLIFETGMLKFTEALQGTIQ